MRKGNAIITLCAVAAAVVGYVAGRPSLPPVEAQGMVSQAGNAICVVGTERNARIPIFLVDTREQNLSVYRYDFNANSLEFSAGRSYQWDKKLETFGDIKGARPKTIRGYVTRQR